MSGSIKLISERRHRLLLDWLSRWQLEASFWAALAVMAWELPPVRSFFIGTIPPFAEWIAVGLAGVAMVTAIQVKWRHHAAWAWIDTLQAEGLIKGDPWPIKAERIKETVRKSHGHLIDDGTRHFDVYRLDIEALHKIMGDALP